MEDRAGGGRTEEEKHLDGDGGLTLTEESGGEAGLGGRGFTGNADLRKSWVIQKGPQSKDGQLGELFIGRRAQAPETGKGLVSASNLELTLRCEQLEAAHSLHPRA